MFGGTVLMASTGMLDMCFQPTEWRLCPAEQAQTWPEAWGGFWSRYVDPLGTHLPRHPVPSLQHNKRAVSSPYLCLWPAVVRVSPAVIAWREVHLSHQQILCKKRPYYNCLWVKIRLKNPSHSSSNSAFIVKHQHDKICRCEFLFYWMTQQGRGHI